MATPVYHAFRTERANSIMNKDDILTRLRALESVENKYILEREQVTRGITIALLNRENILLCGPPGIAKTTQVRLVAQHIIGGQHFYAQLTPFSTVDDIFGPVDISAYKEGIHRRVSAGMLQEAHVAIIDEIYNGNEAVLKALMSPMNEGVFAERGEFHPIPLRTLMGTTNSVPKPEELEDKGLLAFHDRWLFRFYMEETLDNRNFLRMLRTPDIDFLRYSPDPTSCVTIDELEFLAIEAETVQVSASIDNELLVIRDQLVKNHIACSPRRWKQIRRALQSAALVDGRLSVDSNDLALLRHMLWNHPDEVPAIADMLDPYVATAEDRLARMFTLVIEAYGEFSEKQRASRNEGDVVKLAAEARERVQNSINEMRLLGTKLYGELAKKQLEEHLQRSYTYLKRLDNAAGL